MNSRWEISPRQVLTIVLIFVLSTALGALVGWGIGGNADGANIGGVRGLFAGFPVSVIYAICASTIQRYGRPTQHNLLQAFLIAVFLPSRARLVVAVAVGVCLVGVLYLPWINAPLVYAAWPVFELNPGFKKTGPDVEWWFFGPRIRSVKAFVHFALYFTVCCYPLLWPLGYKALREREERRQPHLPSGESAEPYTAADRPPE